MSESQHNQSRVPFPEYPGRLNTRKWWQKLTAWVNQPRVRRVTGANGIIVTQLSRHHYHIELDPERAAGEGE